MASTSITPVLLESHRPISLAKSISSDGVQVCEREPSMMQGECLSVTIGDLPSQKEWDAALNAKLMGIFTYSFRLLASATRPLTPTYL